MKKNMLFVDREISRVAESSPGDPEVAVFEMDDATARRIIDLQSVVQEGIADKVAIFDTRVRWIANVDAEEFACESVAEADESFEHVRTDSDLLNVDATDWWFTSWDRYTDNFYSTRRQKVADLATTFALST